jgi:hypothetical protein
MGFLQVKEISINCIRILFMSFLYLTKIILEGLDLLFMVVALWRENGLGKGNKRAKNLCFQPKVVHRCY